MRRINIVAFDFLGHGDSPRPNQPELYTADEVWKNVQCGRCDYMEWERWKLFVIQLSYLYSLDSNLASDWSGLALILIPAFVQ